MVNKSKHEKHEPVNLEMTDPRFIRLMDIRLRDKLLAEGKITKAQVDAFLNSIPDDSENLMVTELSEGSSGDKK